MAVAKDVPDHDAHPVVFSSGFPAERRGRGNVLCVYTPITPSSGSSVAGFTPPPNVAMWSPSSSSSPTFEYAAADFGSLVVAATPSTDSYFAGTRGPKRGRPHSTRLSESLPTAATGRQLFARR